MAKLAAQLEVFDQKQFGTGKIEAGACPLYRGTLGEKHLAIRGSAQYHIFEI